MGGKSSQKGLFFTKLCGVVLQRFAFHCVSQYIDLIPCLKSHITYITYITRFDGVYRPTLAINNSIKSTNCLSLQACRSPFPCLTFFREKRNKTPNNSKNLFSRTVPSVPSTHSCRFSNVIFLLKD